MKGEKYTFLSAIVPYDRTYLQGAYHAEMQEKLNDLLERFVEMKNPSEYRITNVSVVNLASETGGVPVSPSIQFLLHVGYKL